MSKMAKKAGRFARSQCYKRSCPVIAGVTLGNVENDREPSRPESWHNSHAHHCRRARDVWRFTTTSKSKEEKA